MVYANVKAMTALTARSKMHFKHIISRGTPALFLSRVTLALFEWTRSIAQRVSFLHSDDTILIFCC